MAERMTDRSAELHRLLEDTPPPATAKPTPPPVMRHPRDVRLMPPSRDFH